jgi:hypothetical protein
MDGDAAKGLDLLSATAAMSIERHGDGPRLPILTHPPPHLSTPYHDSTTYYRMTTAWKS